MSHIDLKVHNIIHHKYVDSDFFLSIFCVNWYVNKDAQYILSQLDKILDTAQTVIEILNEKSHQEFYDLAIKDRIELVI